jgi:hypothetical protein
MLLRIIGDEADFDDPSSAVSSSGDMCIEIERDDHVDPRRMMHLQIKI